MNLLPRSAAARLILAFALSLLVHFFILFAPDEEAPRELMMLPPLSARLEPLPVKASVPTTKPQAVSPLVKPDALTPGVSSTDTLEALQKSDESASPLPLPRHLRFRFDYFRDGEKTKSGEILHQLDIHESRYRLKSEQKIIGTASLFNSERLIQTSIGIVGEQGLQPQNYEWATVAKGVRQQQLSLFDWKQHIVHFFDGSEAGLADGVQDSLSFLYQLAKSNFHGEYFTQPVNDGEQLNEFEIEVGAVEKIDTPLGQMRALHLRKNHRRYEPYFEIWLAQDYRLLPVRYRELDGSDQVIAEYIVADMRASDE